MTDSTTREAMQPTWVTPASIPDELKTRDQWVNFPLIWDEAREHYAKPPISAKTLRNASSTNPATWATFDEALAAIGKTAVYKDTKGEQLEVTLAGVGFAGLEQTDLTGIDIDDCVNAETGEIKQYALDVVELFNSYAEISPSGTGIRIFIKGEKPKRAWSGNKGGDYELEVYDSGRYLTVTGHHLAGTPREIEPRQLHLEAFLSRYAPEKETREKKDYTGPEGAKIDLDAFITKHGIKILREINERTAERSYAIVCPWVDEHSGGDESGTRIGQFERGGLFFKCEHGHCEGRKWQDVREHFEPNVYKRMKAGKSVPAGAPRKYALTDVGNGERFADQHGRDVKWISTWHKHVVWTGRKWTPDEYEEVMDRAQKAARSIHKEAEHEVDLDRQRKIAAHAIGSQHASRIRAMIDMAKPHMAATHEGFDTDPWLFNCQNGIVDLRTGELMEHVRTKMMTKATPVEFDPTAEAPHFHAFLAQILPDEEVRRFLQKLYGYALVGEQREAILPILHGSGSNGKSTLMRTVMAAFGDYAIAGARDLLMAKGNAHPTELADLFGTRLVSCMESDNGRRLDEGLVKQLTGGDRIKARKMREDFWEFDPTHTVFLATNHKPEIQGTDHAIWRRVKLVPFNVTIPDAEQDTALPEKLGDELAGILRWAIEGCLAWQREGFKEPQAVTEATQKYREDMDVLALFVADRCVEGPEFEAPAGALYKQYQIWCDNAGEKMLLKQRTFGERLAERGYESFRYTSGANKGRNGWRGIGLRSDLPDPDDTPDTSPSEVSSVDTSPPESTIGIANVAHKHTSGEASEVNLNINSDVVSPREVNAKVASLASPPHSGVAEATTEAKAEARSVALRESLKELFTAEPGARESQPIILQELLKKRTGQVYRLKDEIVPVVAALKESDDAGAKPRLVLTHLEERPFESAPPEVPEEWRGRTVEELDAELGVCRDGERARELVHASHAIAGELKPKSYIDDEAETPRMYVCDEAGMMFAQAKLEKMTGPLAIDLETTALEPEDGLIRLVQLSDGNFTIVFDLFYVEAPTELKEADDA
jgi:putative DNA primase/helicase